MEELKTTGKVKGAPGDAEKILEELKKNPDIAKKISDILKG